MRTKATMPTTPAPRIENTICHGWEGMVCFRMPWVAWKPAAAAGTTKMAAMSGRAETGRTVGEQEPAQTEGQGCGSKPTRIAPGHPAPVP